MRINTRIERTIFTGRSSGTASFRLLAICALPLLCSCAATTLKKTAKSPDYHGGAVGKVAVLTVDERGMLRQGFENRFVKEMGREGQPAVTTFDLLSLPQIKADKKAAAEKLQSSGVGAVLILRLVDMNTRSSSVRAGREVYAPVVTGFGTMGYYGGWYDCYEVAYVDMGTVYNSTQKKILLETVLFDLKEGKQVWSGLTQTVLMDGMDGLVQMDAVVDKVVKAMRKDGLIK